MTVEITKNFDIGEYSVFKYIDTKNNNKITYGPIWDFDLSSGNREGPIGFKAKVENAWLRRFFEDPNFEKLVKSKWLEKRAAILSTMTSSINQNTRKIMSSAIADQLIWEFGTDTNPDWVHVSYESTGKQRKQILVAKRVGGKTTYVPYK